MHPADFIYEAPRPAFYATRNLQANAKMQNQAKKMPNTTNRAQCGLGLGDSLPRKGIQVREFSSELQARIRKFIPSERASMRNPVDFGAGGVYDPALFGRLLDQLFSEKEVDAIVLSGVGEMAPIETRSVDWEVAMAEKAYNDSLRYDKPILFFTPLTRESSTSVARLIDRGVPICHTIPEVVTVLSSLRARQKYLDGRA
jgi:acyl-CoA synthetase (NDP forming)